jgi:hypothetical protein
MREEGGLRKGKDGIPEPDPCGEQRKAKKKMILFLNTYST